MKVFLPLFNELSWLAIILNPIFVVFALVTVVRSCLLSLSFIFRDSSDDKLFDPCL